VRSDLPTGTVTFLFTDIEGSTRLLHALGPDHYAAALAEHRRVLREAFAAHEGVEVDTQGDAFFVAFPTATGAASAALAGNDALAGGPIRVRIGLHTGTPTVTDEGYVGVDVHRAARVAALAHGGQTLLSDATAGLLDGPKLIDLGRHRLKDFDGPVRLHQLGLDGFPPLRTPGSIDLPDPATKFLGREQELFDAVSVVLERDPRVLSIVGPGGTGKTRFAIELARLLAEDAAGGTVFVPLAPLRDPSLVLPALGEALGAEAADPESIAARVGARRTHVVLDNLEQLLPDAALALAATAEVAHELRVLVTSREALRIQAEIEFDLQPLVADEAAALFLTRAGAVRSDLERSATIDELCERLDRMPLALELAAARTKLLSPEALLARIGARLDLLRGSRDADPRHVTLRTTIAWSYDLLDDEERQLFARLAVFRGGCTLESAETVCGADLAVLESLLDKSLLRRRGDPAGGDRFWMHETILEFATEQLAESNEEERLRRSHAEWLVRLVAPPAGRKHHEFRTPAELDLAQRELDNIRAALRWALEKEPELALELSVGLEEFWVIRDPVEGATWHERLLEAAPDAPPALRAAGLRSFGGALDIVGENERAAPCYRASLELLEALGDDDEAWNLRFRIGANAVNRGDPETGWPLIEASLEEFRRSRVPFRETQALAYLGEKAKLDGDLELAARLHSASAAIAHELGWAWWESHELACLAEIERLHGNLETAEQHSRDALALALGIGDRMRSVFAAAELASTAAARGDAEAAAQLWGAIESEEAEGSIGQWPEYRAEYERLVLSGAGPEFEQARAEGRLLSLGKAAGLEPAQP
jgi:predicted ATPase/class 3 adenylate cyclase